MQKEHLRDKPAWPPLFHSGTTESKFRVRSAQSKPNLSAVTRSFATDARRILQTAEQRGSETWASSETTAFLQLKEYLGRQLHTGRMSIPISSS